jgi:hypothetical protein
MSNHPTFSPSTGPLIAYQPKTTDESDQSVGGAIVPHVNVQGGNEVAVKVDNSGVVQPVTVDTLPLPSRAATSDLQTAINNSIISIDGKTPTLGQASKARSQPVVLASDHSPVAVTTPAPSAIVTGQIKITTTGVPVALPSNVLLNGIVIKAKVTNAAQTSVYSAMVGPSGVTTTYDGTGNGYPLAPGEAVSFACANSNLIYVNGTAGDVFSFQGN